MTHWACLTCEAHGETTGTQSGQDAKHVKAAHHSTVTTTSAEFAARIAGAA